MFNIFALIISTLQHVTNSSSGLREKYAPQLYYLYRRNKKD